MYICTKDFFIESCDAYGFVIDGEYMDIEKGSIWHIPEDRDFRCIGGEVRLEADEDHRVWIEISKDTLNESFKLLAKHNVIYMEEGLGKMSEDIQFLKELQAELKTQDSDCQAAPRFWVLRQYEYEPTGEDWMDEYHYIFSDGDCTQFDTTDELVEFLEECELATNEQIEEIKDYMLEDAFNFVLNNLNEDGFFDRIPVRQVCRIIPNTMFLTKAEAKKHIEGNRHHYNDTVHTYAMTAWRAPTVKRLLKILEGFDWDSIS